MEVLHAISREGFAAKLLSFIQRNHKKPSRQPDLRQADG
jgi:hypothetical protein